MKIKIIIPHAKAQYLDMAIDAPTLSIMKQIKKVFAPIRHLESG
jgi:hypothetical protein